MMYVLSTSLREVASNQLLSKFYFNLNSANNLRFISCSTSNPYKYLFSTSKEVSNSHYRWPTSTPTSTPLNQTQGHSATRATSHVYRLNSTSTRTISLKSQPLLPEFDEFKSHEELYKFSLSHPEEFWGRLGRSRLRWVKDFDHVLDGSLEQVNVKWFAGGKLNVTVNCIDRHVEKHPDKTALIWEKDEPGKEEKISYKELSNLVNKIGNVLRSLGVKKGDRVAIYVPVSPMAVASMLACARIGVIHSVVFAGFSAEALASRIQDAKAETIITADQAVRGGKFIDLKSTVDAAVRSCPSIKRVLMTKRTGNSVSKSSLDIDLDELVSKASPDCPAETMSSEDPLFMLYTSGSTGQPKGVTHSQAGYLLYANITHSLVFGFDQSPENIFGCVADVGWITGHTYIVYGPLSNGATTVLFESTPLYPDPGRYWETVQRLKITHFYGAPTAIRMLIKCGDSHVLKYDRSSLKVLGTVGEPINHEAWEWYFRVVGMEKCPIIDTWWQTETGGVCIAPWPSAPGASILPAMPMRPMYGIQPVLMDEQGKPLDGNNVSGALCVAKPWPGMAITLYGAHTRFKETYFTTYPGYYFTGDGAFRDENGHYQMTGRVDDVINISGHRLGTAEIENVLTEHPAIAETAVVGYPHDVKGQGLYAFVVLKDGFGDNKHQQILTEAKGLVKKNIASYAIPDFIQVCIGLPKTRSGKIMRRILRNVAANKLDNFGDISTLAEPGVVDDIVKGRLKK